MAKIDRYNGNLAAFASQADTNRRTTFGTEITGDDTLDGNINSFYLTGWQIVGPNEKPTLQDFNAAFFTIGRLMAYVHQVGMPEWNGEQEYHSGSKVNRGGVEYICTTDSHVSATPPEDDALNWRLPAAADIGYDNTDSGIDAETVQEALDIFGQNSLTGSGHQRLAGGLIIQWTQVIGTTGGTSFSYPFTFPNNLLRISAAVVNSDVPVAYSIGTAGASGGIVYSASGTVNLHIITYGY